VIWFSQENKSGCKDVVTAQAMSHIVNTVRGCFVMHASYVRVTYVVSDPLTQLSRGCILWLRYGGKMKTATPLCFHSYIASMDKCKSWLSSNRTTTVSLSKVWLVLWSFFTYLIKWSSVIYSDGWKGKTWRNPITDLDRLWVFLAGKAPRFQENRPMKVVRLSSLHTGRLYPSGNIPDTHFC
jgi:hypothetical protein